MIKVFLVDDHELVRLGLSRLLAETRDIRVKGTASTAAEALQRLAAPSFPFDLVLLDVSLPDGNGLELIPSIRNRPSAPPVLVLSIHPEDRYAMRAYRKGAAGYFVKDGPLESLAGAIRRVASGGRYVTPEIAEKIAVGVGEDAADPSHLKLSDREFEVLRRIGAGQRSKDIAVELGLSVKTVATFKSRICRKTGLRGTADLVRFAVERRLVQ